MDQARPDWTFEDMAFAEGFTCIVGVDEAGRGPLAGPVTAAAVRLFPGRIPEGIHDSKRLSAPRRTAICAELMAVAEVSVAHATVDEIDRLNVLQASHLAMARALAGLPCAPDLALVDGHLIPKGLPHRCRPVVRGDLLCLSIAAASIVAKVTRDRIMVDLAQQHPGYGWDHNAGYPTKDHLQALLDLGPTPHHRRSFKPVHNILYQEATVSP